MILVYTNGKCLISIIFMKCLISIIFMKNVISEQYIFYTFALIAEN